VDEAVVDTDAEAVNDDTSNTLYSVVVRGDCVPLADTVPDLELETNTVDEGVFVKVIDDVASALEEETEVEFELLEGDCDDSIDGNEDALIVDETDAVADTDGESEDSLEELGSDETLEETDAVLDADAIDETELVALPETLTDNVNDADEETVDVPEGVLDNVSVGELEPERDEVGLGELERDAVGVGVPDPLADDVGVGALGTPAS